MRPKTTSYTCVALDANGYLTTTEGVGAGPWATFLAQPGDNLGHPVTIASSADLRTWTFTLTGTDANGNAVTEDVVGANAGTATSTKYFKTLSNIAASKTLGANTMDVGWTAIGVTATFPTDGAGLSPPVVACLPGGTINFTPQESAIDPFATGYTTEWTTVVAAGTATCTGQAKIGCRALRVLVNSHTSGTLQVTYSQARN